MAVVVRVAVVVRMAVVVSVAVVVSMAMVVSVAVVVTVRVSGGPPSGAFYKNALVYSLEQHRRFFFKAIYKTLYSHQR